MERERSEALNGRELTTLSAARRKGVFGMNIDNSPFDHLAAVRHHLMTKPVEANPLNLLLTNFFLTFINEAFESSLRCR